MTTNLARERFLADMFGEDVPFYALMKDVARKLRKQREGSGISQRALAEDMFTSQAQIARLESGETFAVTLRSIYAMADALECDLRIELVPR